MHFASERGVQAAVRLLLDKGASAVIADSQGRLPFQLASGKTHTLLSKEAERQGGSALKHRWEMCHSKKRKEKTTPFGVNLMRSQVSYRAAQAVERAPLARMLCRCASSTGQGDGQLTTVNHVLWLNLQPPRQFENNRCMARCNSWQRDTRHCSTGYITSLHGL